MVILMHNCRLCQIHTGSIPLQGKLCELVLEVTNIKVNDTLELPSTICLKCNTKIEDINEYITDVKKINTYLHNCIKKYDSLTYSTEVSFGVPNFEKCSNKNELLIGFNKDIAKDECSSDENRQNQLEQINSEGTITRDKYECTECLKLYENQQDYLSHLDAHDQFICKEKNCLKIYNSLRSFKEHQQIHEGKRPFLCVICGKDFASKKCLVCHEKTHASVKGYKCESCNLDFSVRSNLRTHIKKHHEYNRFYCSQCPKKFMSKCSLDRHEKIHVGIKEFKCEDCTSAFYTRKELMKHQKYHQGVKLHKCEICFKAFFERHHLITHKRSHNGERPFACGVTNCGKSFYDKQKLKRHQKSVHSHKEIQI